MKGFLTYTLNNDCEKGLSHKLFLELKGILNYALSQDLGIILMMSLSWISCLIIPFNV